MTNSRYPHVSCNNKSTTIIQRKEKKTKKEKMGKNDQFSPNKTLILNGNHVS